MSGNKYSDNRRLIDVVTNSHPISETLNLNLGTSTTSDVLDENIEVHSSESYDLNLLYSLDRVLWINCGTIVVDSVNRTNTISF